MLSDRMTSNRLLIVTVAALAGTAIVFAAWPSLDVATASLFYAGEARFVGQGRWGDVLRHVLADIPFVVLGAMAILYGLRKLGRTRLWAPNGSGVAMMALSLVLGPGLLVNVILKDHSHRPRPYYLQEFGGPAAFRPFYRFDGACARNCSFASGEGATAFWLVAPALLAPPPVRPAALAAALALGVATSLLRMAFGGHFLSDTMFAALLTWLVVVLTWRLVARLAGRPPGGFDSPPR